MFVPMYRNFATESLLGLIIGYVEPRLRMVHCFSGMLRMLSNQ